jgi:hypothetical protein
MMVDNGGKQLPQALELTELRHGCQHLPSARSAAVLVSGRIGAVEIGILASHEAALLVV